VYGRPCAVVSDDKRHITMAEQPKKCKGTARFRNAVITSFNTDVSLVGVWQSNQDKISYLIGQKEICPPVGASTGRSTLNLRTVSASVLSKGRPCLTPSVI